MKKLLKKAVQTGKKINIIYLSPSNAVSKRMIHIISYTDEHITGYCYMRQQIRTFKLANILAVEKSKQKMEVFV